MSNRALRDRRKSNVDNNTFVGKSGEIVILPEDKTIAVHDGLTQGGIKLSKEDANFTSTHRHPAATQSTPGFLSTADKIKLDNISQQALPPASSQNNPDTLVRRDVNGDFAARNITAVQFIGALTGLATGISGNLTGDVTSAGMVTSLQSVMTAGNYGSSAEVPRLTVDAKGRITAIQLQPITSGAGGAAGGDLGGNYPNPTVELVGTRTKAQISQSVLDTINATNSPTSNTIVRRDGTSKFRSGLTAIGDSSDTVVSKSYVDALGGGGGGYSNFAVYRINPTNNTAQERSINGAAFSTTDASVFAVPSNVRVIGFILVSAGSGGLSGVLDTPVATTPGGVSGAILYSSMVPVLPGSNLTVSVGVGGSGGRFISSTGITIAPGSGGNTSISGLFSFLTASATKVITVRGGVETPSNAENMTSGTAPIYYMVPNLGGDFAYFPNFRIPINIFGRGGPIGGTPNSTAWRAFGSFFPIANVLELGDPPASTGSTIPRSGIGSGGTTSHSPNAAIDQFGGPGGHGYAIIFY